MKKKRKPPRFVRRGILKKNDNKENKKNKRCHLPLCFKEEGRPRLWQKLYRGDY